ncbi:hypothetical protein [Pseudonocardia sp. NPDC049154]|jgi:hypothetical protein|uniref:hypothetical protein n=1 Tax=Pseudonocardia sp. NPDC049154 TaxID=3155501 RepID=UPI0033C5A395
MRESAVLGVSGGMPIVERVKRFLQSPSGRRLTDQGRRMAADPRNRERARGMLTRFRRR